MRYTRDMSQHLLQQLGRRPAMSSVAHTNAAQSSRYSVARSTPTPPRPLALQHLHPPPPPVTFNLPASHASPPFQALLLRPLCHRHLLSTGSTRYHSGRHNGTQVQPLVVPRPPAPHQSTGKAPSRIATLVVPTALLSHPAQGAAATSAPSRHTHTHSHTRKTTLASQNNFSRLHTAPAPPPHRRTAAPTYNAHDSTFRTATGGPPGCAQWPRAVGDRPGRTGQAGRQTRVSLPQSFITPRPAPLPGSALHPSTTAANKLKTVLLTQCTPM